MKKYIIAIICILLVFAGVTLALVLNEKEDDDFILTIQAEDVELYVGETEKVNYKCSINGIPVIKRIANSKIATIEDEYITAKKAGVTQLTLEAKYKGERTEKIITVIVLEETENPELDSPNQGQDPDDDTSENDGNSTPEVPEVQEPIVEKPVILFETENMVNCIVENNILILEKDVVGRFSVYLENNVTCSISVISENEFVEVTKITSMSGNVYKIKGTAEGEYEIVMSVNGSDDVIFSVVVR